MAYLVSKRVFKVIKVIVGGLAMIEDDLEVAADVLGLLHYHVSLAGIAAVDLLVQMAACRNLHMFSI